MLVGEAGIICLHEWYDHAPIVAIGQVSKNVKATLMGLISPGTNPAFFPPLGLTLFLPVFSAEKLVVVFSDILHNCPALFL